jgi:hypothetical protein
MSLSKKVPVKIIVDVHERRAAGGRGVESRRWLDVRPATRPRIVRTASKRLQLANALANERASVWKSACS